MTTKQAAIKNGTSPQVPKNIMAPQTLDLDSLMEIKSVVHDWNDRADYGKGMVGLMEKTSSQQVSAQIKIEVMQRAVAIYPKVNMGCGGEEDSFTA